MRAIGLPKISFIGLCLIFSCSVNTPVTINRVVVSTVIPDLVTNNSARLIGNLSSLGDFGVIDHGFVLSKSPKPTLADKKISLGSTNVLGQYVTSIADLEEGVTYYVRAYATDGKGTRYDGDSDTQANTNEGRVFSTLSLSVFSFLPTAAKAGDIITLKGNNFSLIPGNNIVEFGNVRGIINTVSANEITVMVPEGITTRSSKIYLTVDGKTAVSYDFFNLISGSWSKKADFGGGPRKYAASFTIGDKAYVLLGQDGSSVLKTDFWQYDPATDTWAAKSNFPGDGRTEAVAFSIDTKGYVGTGEGSLEKKKDFWEYDSNTDTWYQKNDFAGTARSGAMAFSLNGKGYIGLGNDGSLRNDLWEYEVGSDTWIQKANFPGTPRYGAVSFTIENLGYVGTGLNHSGVTSDFFSYDPIQDSWNLLASIPGSPRYFSAGFSINGKGYIGTGYSTTQVLNDIWEYDVISNTWFQSASFEGTARYGVSSFVINNKAYLGIGIATNSVEKDFWEFTTAQ